MELETCPAGIVLAYEGDFGRQYYMECAVCGENWIDDVDPGLDYAEAKAEYRREGWHQVRRPDYPEKTLDEDAWICPDCWKRAVAALRSQ